MANDYARSIADLRRDYAQQSLDLHDVDEDPFVQFTRWFADAQADVREPNAMTLATVTPQGEPAARIVLLKGVDEHAGAGTDPQPRGFVFYTNRESRKGRYLAANPYASLVFWWPELERQVRIDGRVVMVPDAESDAYFKSRPRGSRLGAWASAQSQAIDDRATLEQRVADAEARFASEETIPRPPHWGGYRVIPRELEFWQGRPSRAARPHSLHTRRRRPLDPAPPPALAGAPDSRTLFPAGS